MEQQRNLLFILLLCAAMFLFWDWNSDKANALKEAENAAVASLNQEINDKSDISNTVTIKSDNLELTVNLKGGDVIDAKLLKIKQYQDKDDPFHLLMTNNKFLYQAQSGLAGKDGIDNQFRPEFTVAQKEFLLKDGENTVVAKIENKKEGVN